MGLSAFEQDHLNRESAISAYGTGLGVFIREDFCRIVMTEGNEDEVEIDK